MEGKTPVPSSRFARNRNSVGERRDVFWFSIVLTEGLLRSCCSLPSFSFARLIAAVFGIRELLQV